jgi:hypothetical protein
MAEETTLTVLKTTKAQYDRLRKEVNSEFRQRFDITIAFRQSQFFAKVIGFILSHEDEFLDYIGKPTDESFWTEDP